MNIAVYVSRNVYFAMNFLVSWHHEEYSMSHYLYGGVVLHAGYKKMEQNLLCKEEKQPSTTLEAGTL